MRCHGLKTLALVALAGFASSCAGPSAPTTVPVGQWGGDQVRLIVESTRGTIEFSCAHGSFDGALRLDRRSAFDITGVYVREGGPIRLDETPFQHPARYFGTTDGRRMTLTVAVTD